MSELLAFNCKTEEFQKWLLISLILPPENLPQFSRKNCMFLRFFNFVLLQTRTKKKNTLWKLYFSDMFLLSDFQVSEDISYECHSRSTIVGLFDPTLIQPHYPKQHMNCACVHMNSTDLTHIPKQRGPQASNLGQ